MLAAKMKTRGEIRGSDATNMPGMRANKKGSREEAFFCLQWQLTRPLPQTARPALHSPCDRVPEFSCISRGSPYWACCAR